MSAEAPVVRRAGVVGAGVMGISIAHLCSSAGIETAVKVRPRPGAVEQAWQALRASYAREVQAGRMAQSDAEAALGRLGVTGDYADLAGCEIVIESVPEDLSLKHEVIRAIEDVTAADAVFGSNTSSFPVSALALAAARPERVVGTHYFWPAHRQPLLEISAAPATPPEVVERVRALGRQQRRVELLVGESPGLFTTRVLLPYLSEAILLAGQGVPIEQVDAALEAFGWRMGPFRMMDAVGVETVAHAGRFLYPHLGERLAGLIRLWQHVREGRLDRRAGTGFYLYDNGSYRPNPDAQALLRNGDDGPADPEEYAHRPVWLMVAEAARCVAEGVVAGWEDADVGANLGLVFPKNQGGLLAYRNRVGEETIQRQFVIWERRYGPRFCLE